MYFRGRCGKLRVEKRVGADLAGVDPFACVCGRGFVRERL